MNDVSRKQATYLNLTFQYFMLGVMIVRGLILPPIAAKFIDHDLLGAWFASGNIVQWLLISEGGAWLYLRQKTAYEYGRNDKKSLSQAIGSGGLCLLLLGALIIGVGLVIAPHIPGLMNVSLEHAGELQLAFTLTVIGVGISLPACIPRAVAHGLQRQVSVNVSQLLAEVISLSVSIWLIVIGYGVLALGVGPLVREIVHNIINWPILLFQLKAISVVPTLSFRYFKEMSRQMGWTFLMNLNRVMRRNVDALIVSQVFGNSAVLVVEWTKRAWELFSSLVLRATSAFTPGLAHLYGEGDVKKVTGIIERLFAIVAIALAFILAFGLMFNFEFVSLWLGSEFYAGDSFNLLLGLSTVAASIAFVVSETLFATGNVKIPAIAQLVFSVIRLLLLFALVPFIGLLAIPLSLLLTDVCGEIIFLLWQWNQKLGISRQDSFRQIFRLMRVLVFAVVMVFFAKFALTFFATSESLQFLSPVDSWVELVLYGVAFALCIFTVLYIAEAFFRNMVNEAVMTLKQLSSRISIRN